MQSRQYALKHRLTGATILVVAAVVLIPMFLSEPQQRGAGGAQVGGDKVFSATIENVNAARIAKPGAPAPKSKPKPALLPQTELAKPAATQKPAAPKTPAAGPQWVVRVGAFAKKSNVDSVSAQLKKIGIRANYRKITNALGQEVTRIWLGPYAKKSSADKIGKRVKALIGDEVKVVKHNS